MPSSPRGWLAWSAYVRESQSRPHSPNLEYGGRSDPRMRGDSKETAISVVMLAERASHSVCRNGIGLKLMVRHFVDGEPLAAFSTRQQSVLRRTIKQFRRELQDVGFVPPDLYLPR